MTHVLDAIFDFYSDETEPENVDAGAVADAEREWYFAELEHVDPLKEADAAIKLIDARLMTRAEWFAKFGQDWEQQIEQCNEEMQRLNPPTVPTSAPTVLGFARGGFDEPNEGGEPEADE